MIIFCNENLNTFEVNSLTLKPMKAKFLISLLIIAGAIMFLLLAGCSKDGGGGGGKYSKVTLKGKFSTTKAGEASTATKVLVFDYSSKYVVADIMNGSFSIQVNKDEPVGLIFTNEAKEYLGYLTMGQGFESLPLNYLNDSIASLDFGTLRENILTISPENGFNFGKFEMTLDERQMYGQASINFSAIIRNPDVDRNGIVDILENKHYRISFLYFMDNVYFSRTGQPNRNLSASLDAYSMMLNTQDASTPGNESVVFLMPDGTRVSSKQKKTIPEDGSTMYFSDNISAMPQGGITRILYGNDTLYYDVPSQSGTFASMITTHPNFVSNASGSMTEISWTYYKGNTTTIANPENIIYVTQIQVDGENFVRLWEDNHINPDKNKITLPSPIPLNSVKVINVGYYNYFGNNVIQGYWPQ